MEHETTVADTEQTADAAAAGGDPGELEDEQLIEEISIDGMCGVY